MPSHWDTSPCIPLGHTILTVDGPTQRSCVRRVSEYLVNALDYTVYEVCLSDSREANQCKSTKVGDGIKALVAGHCQQTSPAVTYVAV